MDTRKLEKSKKNKSVLEDQDQDSSIGSSDMSGSSNSDKNLYQEFMMYLETKRLKEKRRTEKNSKAEKRPKEVELIKGSKIMINRFKLDLYTQSNRKNPREMARKILKLIFSEDDLAKMTITGKKGRKQMPEDTYENVYDYVNSHTAPGMELTAEEFQNCVCRMLCGVRDGLKKKNNANDQNIPD
ncbi:uncharacterized protein LOC141536232 [Cotesia typhae]|uniref:uncharacterized protein LOC141536232 n=1 Tax=Cotesia typhae TaxID=2053667 RepID=UPI003D6805F2